MPTSVAILGGGIAGLSAAHELVERGFDVTIYEKRNVCGGKARSIPIPGTGSGGRPDLPGEHGFRFFPSFYRHLPDTMSRIPYGILSVADLLVRTDRTWVTRAKKTRVELPNKLPQRREDWMGALHLLFDGIGVPPQEVVCFLDRLLTLATSCTERRDSEYEQQPWWDFIGAASRSKEYQTLLAQGLTRSLVAMKAEIGSTRTVGYILLQLLYGILSPEGFDRVLSGPSNDVWLAPWVAYLKSKGVQIVNGVTVQAIQTDSSGVNGVLVEQSGQSDTILADYYLAALPVEIMRVLAADAQFRQHVPSLAGLSQLCTSWMNGIQFYFRLDVPLNNGHTLYADSQWALTSISQNQFWSTTPLSGFGDGQIGGILSVNVSEWEEKGKCGKTAKDCTADEIKREVWAELQDHLNIHGDNLLQDGNLARWFLDEDIQFPNPKTCVNAEPLLINKAGTLRYRPDVCTALPNLFLASDYVRTYTDLACMESANEAARRAVNGILNRAGSVAARAGVWTLQEPRFFGPMIEFDRIRFKLGLPHGSPT